MTHLCPHCHQEVPLLRFCVRCGMPLADGDDGTARRHFAAAPGEHHLLPAYVSSLFPHLPRAGMRHYRIAMALGTAIVVGLAVGGLFPVALAAAALLVPVLAALYLRDVNVYEEEPLRVIAGTLAWGAIAGAALALLGHALAPTGLDGVATGHRSRALVSVIVLPLVELALAVAGPALVLLPRRRYGEILDGITFGAAAAAALSATEVIVSGYRLFAHGLRPGGQVLPWIWRLLTIRLALPVLAMAATGAACGALWLRFRGTAEQREAVGFLGRPVPAFGLRALMLMAAAAGQRWLPVGLWLVTLLVLDAVALVWLRLMVHAGLEAENRAREIGPEVTCANCGEMTPSHTFCGHCGVALKALPAKEHAHATRLITTSRAVALAAFVGLTVLAAGIVAVIAPASPHARCPPTGQCGAPPKLAESLRTETVWRSPAFGFSLEYPPSQWRVSATSDSGIDLRSTVAPVELVVRGAPARAPQALISAEVSDLRGNLLGLTADTSAANAVLGSAIGYVRGAGASYVGSLDSAQGVQDQALVTVLGASFGQVGIVAAALTTETRATQRHAAYGLVDEVLNSVTWPGQT